MKFFFHVVKESANRQDAFKETVRNVLSGTWPASKPFQRGCQEKLARLWDQWRSLQKSKSKAAQDKVERFKCELDLLWEIGASDAIEIIEKNRLLTTTDKQDIAFYQDQRGKRQASMSRKDKLFAAKKRQQDAHVERQTFE